MVKRWVILFGILLLTFTTITGCNGFIPSEGEGEGEPEQEQGQVVLIELYIQDGCTPCSVIEPILEQMAAKDYSREEMILVELALKGEHFISQTKDRYHWYLTDRTERSTPNTLFNGLRDRIHGSSNKANIKQIIDKQLNSKASLYLEASRKTELGNTIITGKVKNISNYPLT